MVKKLLILLFTFAFAFPLSTLMIAQDAPMKAAKEARWQGTVIRSSPDKSTLTVRDRHSVEMIVQYDSSTRWVSQEHGSKKVNDIDASQIKDKRSGDMQRHAGERWFVPRHSNLQAALSLDEARLVKRA